METKPSLSNKTYTLYELAYNSKLSDCFNFIFNEIQSFSTISEVIQYVESRWVADETMNLIIQENDEDPQPYYTWRNFYYNAYK